MSKELISSFYKAFQEGNGEAMASMYHPDAQFSDPVFQKLNESEVGAMWKMLIERSKGDLKITLHSIEESEGEVSCIWEANYAFSKTGRRVHNMIKSTMIFLDGKIIDHKDHFNFWKWSGMALGTSGLLLGWSPIVKNKVKGIAQKGLNEYIKKSDQ